MSAAAVLDEEEPPTIVFKEAVSGTTWEWTPPADLWLDIQAYAAVTGLTIEALIHRALTDWFDKEGESLLAQVNDEDPDELDEATDAVTEGGDPFDRTSDERGAPAENTDDYRDDVDGLSEK